MRVCNTSQCRNTESVRTHGRNDQPAHIFIFILFNFNFIPILTTMTRRQLFDALTVFFLQTIMLEIQEAIENTEYGIHTRPSRAELS